MIGICRQQRRIRYRQLSELGIIVFGDAFNFSRLKDGRILCRIK